MPFSQTKKTIPVQQIKVKDMLLTMIMMMMMMIQVMMTTMMMMLCKNVLTGLIRVGQASRAPGDSEIYLKREIR